MKKTSSCFLATGHSIRLFVVTANTQASQTRQVIDWVTDSLSQLTKTVEPPDPINNMRLSAILMVLVGVSWR